MEISTLVKKYQKLKIYDDIKSLWHYIEPLLNDLGETGNEVVHHDIFLDIKSEIEKITNIQVDKIENGAIYLCQNIGKDIRVICYLTYALFKNEAYKGLIKGLVLLYSIQILFPKTYQPQKVAIIRNILLWLSSEKMENIFLLCQELPTGKDIYILNTIISSIQNEFSYKFNQPFNELDSLSELINSINKNAVIHNDFQKDNLEDEKIHENMEEKQNQEIIIKSSQDLMNSIKYISKYITNHENNQWAALHLTRQFRWDLLTKLPINCDGVTKIIPPRKELINELRILYQKKDWQRLIEYCNTVFLEASNHFYLDLQYLTWTAITELSQKNIWADILVCDISFLLERLPKLETFLFLDKTPFASIETLDWINHNARFTSLDDNKSTISTENSNSFDANLESQAFAILKNQGFEEVLQWIDNIELDDNLEYQYKKKYLIAKLALADKKLNFAFYLLDNMNDDFSKSPLYDWDKKFTFDIKYTLLTVLMQKNKIHFLNSNNNLPESIVNLVRDLVKLNPSLVYNLLYK